MIVDSEKMSIFTQFLCCSYEEIYFLGNMHDGNIGLQR